MFLIVFISNYDSNPIALGHLFTIDTVSSHEKTRVDPFKITINHPQSENKIE